MKIIVTLLIIMVFVVVLFIFNSQTSNAPTSISPSFSPSPSVIPPDSLSPPTVRQPKVYEIIITDTGLSAPELTIRKGDIVTFVNKSKNLVWPASGPHPTHGLCPGFDALAGLSLYGTYSFTFTKAGTCQFHDHLNAAKTEFRGKIMVKE